MKRSLLLLVLAGWIGSACAKPVGTVTIINSGDAPLKGSLGEQTFAVKPDQGWSRGDIAQGDHELTVSGAKEPLKVNVQENQTTVVDPMGKACYVVVDYRKQYGDNPSSNVEVVERFKAKQVFTSKFQLIPYGRKLPQKIPEGTHARRLHKIECDILNDDQKISDALARLP